MFGSCTIKHNNKYNCTAAAAFKDKYTERLPFETYTEKAIINAFRESKQYIRKVIKTHKRDEY